MAQKEVYVTAGAVGKCYATSRERTGHDIFQRLPLATQSVVQNRLIGRIILNKFVFLILSTILH